MIPADQLHREMLILTRDIGQIRKDLKHLQESLIIALDQGKLELDTGASPAKNAGATVIPLHPSPPKET